MNQNALMIELSESGLKSEKQSPIKVKYKGKIIGDYIADIVVEDKIILEIKAVDSLQNIHEAQLVNYLNGTKKDIGLLINFGPTGVDVKRKYRDSKIEH